MLNLFDRYACVKKPISGSNHFSAFGHVGGKKNGACMLFFLTAGCHLERTLKLVLCTLHTYGVDSIQHSLDNSPAE